MYIALKKTFKKTNYLQNNQTTAYRIVQLQLPCQTIIIISNNIPPGLRVVSLYVIGFASAIFLALKYHSIERQ